MGGPTVQEYLVAFWNVENLFDVDNSPERPQWLQKTLANELEGWDEAVLQRKIGQLAHIIRQMNNGRGPDILGVCEIENENVLHDLVNAIGIPNRRYEVAHADTGDKRGIDVAFLLDSERIEKGEQFSYEVLKRTATRDIFQVNVRLRESGNELIVIGNHWPSRRGGQYESEPYRILAGETLAYWHQRIREEKGANAAVLAMGDFNDEPYSRSLTNYALSTYQRRKVLNAQSPRFYNLMWPLLGARRGTHFYNNFANMLDQFLASRGLIRRGAALSVDEGSVRIETFTEMVASGDYPAPVRFGRPSSGYDPDGFSDHFPISVVLRET